ncbi:MAG: DUF5666 domain-containing protein [Methylorubrum populi]
MSRLVPTRRGLLALLAGTALWRPRPAWPQAEGDPVQDRGIGGTGARPSQEETPGGDRGIGGTGVIGTIRRFGSIVVNDLRITYPPDVRVRIDGAPARVADLRLGHVVRVAARGGDGGLSTRAIDVTSEVVGPVEAVARGRLTVLGQTVSTAGLKTPQTFAVGERVAVSGLRRGDGTVVASLIEPRPDGAARVAGPVRRGRDGALRIGGLRLEGLEPALAGPLTGRRTLVQGTVGAGSLTVTSARDVSRPFPAGLGRASIEAYVAQSGGALRLGSGLAVSGRIDPASLPSAGRPAVIETGIGPGGRMSVEAVRGEAPGRGGQGPGEPGTGGQGVGGRGLGGRGPGNPGSGPSGRSGPGGEAPFARPGGRDPGGFGSGGNSMPGGYPIDTRPGTAPGSGSGPGGAFGAPSGGFGRPGGGGPGGFGGGGSGGFGGGGPGGRPR